MACLTFSDKMLAQYRSSIEGQPITLEAAFVYRSSGANVLLEQQNHLRTERKQSSLWFWLAVAGVCWLAWLIFTIHLAEQSMWGDENFTWVTSNQGLFGLVRATAKDVHPPFYYMWVWAWMTWTGNQTLFMLRLSSAIPALLAVAFCIRLGWEWFNSRLVGLVAALFLGTSGIFVYYSRDLRMYPLIVFMVAMNWWLLGRLYKGKPRSFWGYAASLGLMAYTYYFSAVVVFAQVTFTLLFYRRKLREVILAGLVSLIAFAPWLPTFLAQLREARAQSGLPNPPIIGKFLGTTPTTWEAISTFIGYYTAKQPAYVFLLIALALTLGLSASVSRQYRHWVIAIALWLFMTVILFFTVNLLIPVYGLAFPLPVISALALLVGVAVQRLPTNRARLGAAMLVGVLGIVTHVDGFKPPRTPHRELLSTVAAHYQVGDKIWYNLTYGALGSSLANEGAYHLKFDAPNLKPEMFVWAAPSDYSDLKANPRVWDVRPYFVPLPDKAAGPLKNGRIVTEEYDFQGYSVRLYEAPPQQTPVAFGDLFDMLTSPPQQMVYHPGETVSLKTWWRSKQPPNLDYSYGLYLFKANTRDKVGEANAGLDFSGIPTSQLVPAETYTFAKPEIKLPANLAPGDYDLWLSVYFYVDPNTKLAVQTAGDQVVDTSTSIVRVGQIHVG